MALFPATSAWGNVYTVTIGAADVPDPTPDNGICDSGGGVCTLRGAVQTANGTGAPGFDTIEVPFDAGFPSQALTRPNPGGVDEDMALDGDLDLTTSVEIKGTGGTPTITGNTPTAVDRIFHIPSGSPTVTLSSLTITKGQAPDGGWGGGIKQESGSLTIANSVIFDNDALGGSARGGGIYSSGGSSLTLTDVDVNFNEAATLGDNGGRGGGVYSLTPVTFTRVTIRNNDVSFGCGGICGGSGGGATLGGGTLTNVTVSANIAGGVPAGAGGGIAHVGSPLTLINSTVANNTAQSSVGLGGGNLLDFVGGTSLQSTIVDNGAAPNQPGTENCAVDNGSFTSLGHNLEARPGQGASQCGLNPGTNGDITAASAGLDPLGFNGGPTPTHRLQVGSPAIDAGAMTGPATDQRAFELEQTGTIPGSTCAGPPTSQPPVDTGIAPPSTAPSPTAVPRKKKCKRKKRAAAAKKCKKRR